MPPHFQVMDERQASEVMRLAREKVIASAQSDAAIAKALGQVTENTQETAFSELFQIIAAERHRLRNFIESMGGIDAAIEALYKFLEIQIGTTATKLETAFCQNIGQNRKSLVSAAKIQVASTDKFNAYGQRVLAFLNLPTVPEQQQNLSDYLRAFLTKEGTPIKSIMATKDRKQYPLLYQALDAEQQRVLAYIQQIKTLKIATANAGLLKLSAAMMATYAEMKKDRGRLDYDDLVLKTVDLLTSAQHVAAWVLYKLDGGLDHILIDEAQDTNPEQWNVVKAMAEEFFTAQSGQADGRPRTIFAVGDVKQSIYSFQRADPKSFVRFQNHFRTQVQHAKLDWDDVPMDVSFRSAPLILALVDKIFQQADCQLGPDINDISHHAFRQGHAGRIELWPVSVPVKNASLPPWTLPDTQRLGEDHPMQFARILATQIASWFDPQSPRILASQNRPLRPRDILILVRTRSMFFIHLVRELKNRNVPVAGMDRIKLSAQVVVDDLMALIQFLLLQQDSLSLAVILKSPLIGFTEEDLMAVALDRDGDLWQALETNTNPFFVRVTQWLKNILAKVDLMRPFELLSFVLSHPCPGAERLGAVDSLSGRQCFLARLGPETTDHIEEFLTLALSYEQGSVPSLQGFAHWFTQGETVIKRDLEAAERDEVRIMTIHGAKGLQAPLVILPDTGQEQKSNSSPKLFWHHAAQYAPMPLWLPSAKLLEKKMTALQDIWQQEQQAEYHRLLYVALTRAEDQLIICGYGAKKASAPISWYNLVKNGVDALYADLPKTIADSLTPASQKRENNRKYFAFAQSQAQQPHSPQHGILTQDMNWEGEGIIIETKHHTAVPVTPPLTQSPETSTTLPDWAKTPPKNEPARPFPLVPSAPIFAPPAMPSPRAVETYGLQRGLIIHRLLQSLPDIEETLREGAIARYLDQPHHGLTREQKQAIGTETLAVLNREEMAKLYGPNSRAEVAITGEIGPDDKGKSFLVTGQIDRLVVLEKQIIIGDYKTLRPVPDNVADTPKSYLHQMATYRKLIQKIYPTHQTICVIIWTDGPQIMPIPDDLLDQQTLTF